MVQEPLTKLRELLDTFGVIKNKSRKDFATEMIGACIEGRSVVFSEMAQHFNRSAKVSSIERRIQDFFLNVDFDYEKLICLLICFVPHDKVILSIDRTEWDRGAHQYNILCIVVSIGKMAIPLYFELLDNNSGNSNVNDRIKVLKKVVKRLGRERIRFLVMDREFIGHEWLRWLKKEKIKFCVRVPKHHRVTTIEGKRIDVEELWRSDKNRTQMISNAIVDGVVVNVSISTGADGELLYLIGTISEMSLKKAYQKRWAIEVFFQATKSRGFYMEQTGLRDDKKLRKLFGIVSIAYAVCWMLGIEDGKINPVKPKKHGYPQYSVFRRGLNLLRQALRNGIDTCIAHVFELINIRADKLC